MGGNEILDKIRKLLLKAHDTQNAHEAAAFLAKAQALQLQYKIDVVDLDRPNEKAQLEATPLNEEDEGKEKLATWKSQLAGVLSKANGVFVFVSSGKILLSGRENDRNAVRYLYCYCVNEIERLTRRHARGRGRTYSNNFRLGCVSAISKAIANEFARRRVTNETSCRALMVMDQLQADYQEAKQLAEESLSIRKTKRSVRGNFSAVQAGERAGQEIYGQSRIKVGNQFLIN